MMISLTTRRYTAKISIIIELFLMSYCVLKLWEESQVENGRLRIVRNKLVFDLEMAKEQLTRLKVNYFRDRYLLG